MTNIKTVYWDSCVWIRLINQETDHEACQSILDAAQRGEIVIWTSCLTLAEVYKFKCESLKTLSIEKDEVFEAYMQSDFVQLVQVDQEIGIRSRRLCRNHACLKKPNDGIHLASAVVNNIDEFHSFDVDDLLRLNGDVMRADGAKLVMCKPYIIEPPAKRTDSSDENPNQLRLEEL